MLGPGGDDVVAALLMRFRNAFDRQIVRFAAPAREDDLIRPRAQQHCYLLPRPLDRLMGSMSVGVGAGRIAEPVAQVWQHSVKRLRIDRGRRVVVQVNDLRHG
jgi:hypothetical protein